MAKIELLPYERFIGPLPQQLEKIREYRRGLACNRYDRLVERIPE